MKIKTKKNRTFIFGAGFSSMFGYPVMNQLFPLLIRQIQLKTLDSNFGIKISDIDFFLSRVNYLCPKFSTKKLNYSSIDIEEFLTMVDVRINLEKSRTKGEGKTWETIRNKLLLSLCALFYKLDSKTLTTKQQNILEIVKTIFNSNDYILTLNWDCFIEKYFDCFRHNYNYIKMHGSYNLFDKEFCFPRFRIGDPVVIRQWRGNANVNHVASFITAEGFRMCMNYRKKPLAHTPYILYPSVHKEYSLYYDVLLKARKFLSSSEEIFIFGYSFPYHDHYLKAIFRSALRQGFRRIKRIVVVDSNIFKSGLASRLIEVLGYPKKFEFIEMDISDYLRTEF